MKQQQFEREHDQTWQRFRELLSTLETRRRPGPEVPVQRLPRLLRRISGHYALARSRGYSPGLIDELHRLLRRGYRQLYRVRPAWPRQALDFALGGFPRALRRHLGLFWLSCALFFGPMAVMGLACAQDGALIYNLLQSDQVAAYESMYDPNNARLGRSTERQADSDFMMFGFYIRNNVGIALRTFAWGLAFGVGSLFVLASNGLFTGAVAGHLTQVGFGRPFWSFVSGHSSLELTAIAIAGAAGLLLAKALLAPGRRTRGAALRMNAAEAVQLVLGAMLMLILAAVVEAFWSSSQAIPVALKYGVGVGGWLLVAAYLGLAGRSSDLRVKPPLYPAGWRGATTRGGNGNRNTDQDQPDGD
jgi:uncharacterized membrane protein SpoIIM required for sporulation